MISERKKRSVKIAAKDLSKIRKAISSYPTWLAAQTAIGVDRTVLNRLTYQDTCSPDTKQAIDNFLQSQKVA